MALTVTTEEGTPFAVDQSGGILACDSVLGRSNRQLRRFRAKLHFGWEELARLGLGLGAWRFELAVCSICRHRPLTIFPPLPRSLGPHQ